MKIHEYQAKNLFRRYGVAVPIGHAASSPDEAIALVKKVQAESGGEVTVVKAQIHAGGRGKGGGVKVCKTAAEAEKAVRDIFGMQLVTPQTGAEGQKVQRLLVEQGLPIEHEYYVGLTLDRDSGRVTVMASTEGGMEIEEVAERNPDAIIKEAINPAVGWQDYQGRRIGFRLGMNAKQVGELCKFLAALCRCYEELDCALVEINPLVTTTDGRVLALDAKVNFDDNALYRQEDVTELRDLSEEEPAEVEATEYGLSFIKLDGTIGCLVNGAGLAMATMDTIKEVGGEPANFLDVGGGATVENVTAAFEIITKDPAVKGIFVNIFGGIMKCDTIATGVVQAVHNVGLRVPLVVRLEGTNVELGKRIIEEAGLPGLVTAASMREGAERIVELTR